MGGTRRFGFVLADRVWPVVAERTDQSVVFRSIGVGSCPGIGG
jgi:hypothetical protein